MATEAHTLTVGDYNASGLAQITDTRWDSNGSLMVTVRETVGGFDSWVGGKDHAIRIMRTLARRALTEYHEGQTKRSPLMRTWFADGQHHATFMVSRNS